MLLFEGRLNEAKATVNAALEAAKASGKPENEAHSLISRSRLERELALHSEALKTIDDALQRRVRG